MTNSVPFANKTKCFHSQLGHCRTKMLEDNMQVLPRWSSKRTSEIIMMTKRE